MVKSRRHPTTPPWPSTGPPAAQRLPRRWTASACGCSRRQGCCPLCGTTRCPPPAATAVPSGGLAAITRTAAHPTAGPTQVTHPVSSTFAAMQTPGGLSKRPASLANLGTRRPPTTRRSRRRGIPGVLKGCQGTRALGAMDTRELNTRGRQPRQRCRQTQCQRAASTSTRSGQTWGPLGGSSPVAEYSVRGDFVVTSPMLVVCRRPPRWSYRHRPPARVEARLVARPRGGGQLCVRSGVS